MSHTSAEILSLLHATYDLSKHVSDYMTSQLGNDANDLAWQEMYAVSQALGSAITQLQVVQKRTSQTTPERVCVNGTTYVKQAG